MKQTTHRAARIFRPRAGLHHQLLYRFVEQSSEPDQTARKTIGRSLFVTMAADSTPEWWYTSRLPGGPSKGMRDVPWRTWYSDSNAEPPGAAMRSDS